MGHSIQIKEAVLQKVLSGNKTHDEISKEFGIGRSTIGKWLREYRKGGNINLTSKKTSQRLDFGRARLSPAGYGIYVFRGERILVS
ncbi:helix-turn-helix domain-containing protein [Desulfobacter postgatei]|uniref:helix-turn-helix domain-containing protein n=1 Tax=Desulfobacter postgatei TaxID=2293 RepID=UPI001FE20FA6|nr:helix-turn-helix domain-containing protein [Desulfobacter postgatei]